MQSLLARLPQRPALACAFLAAAPLGASPGALVAPGPQEPIDAAGPTEDLSNRVRIEGTVLLPDGGPAQGAVVVSSAGGQASVRPDGSFALELALAPEALAVELTAVASGASGTLVAQRRLEGLQDEPTRHAGTLVMAPSPGCVPDWIPTFGETPGTDHTIWALAVFDDGSGAGPALYAGGYFTSAGGQPANRIARWNGESWSALGSGMNTTVWALTVFDDGSGAGPALYAGGTFTSAGGQPASRVAKWDGQGWSALGSGVTGSIPGSTVSVDALAVFDDGSGAGPALYAGGNFLSAGGASASYVARWDGQSWSGLSTGVGNRVFDMTVFDDGSGAGPALYAGGRFTSAGGQPANRIARWNGESWSALGSGTNLQVFALAVFDDGAGGGPALYAGGDFTAAGGEAASRVARWDGQSWSALSTGMDADVFALTVFDDGSGSGPALCAGGYFTTAGGVDASHVARWDGRSWSPLGTGLGAPFDAQAKALVVFDDGSGAGPSLYAGGVFTTAGDVSPTSHVARWDGQGWSTLGTGLGGPTDDASVMVLSVFDGGSGKGSALYAAGSFVTAGGEQAGNIARWDGHAWTALSTGTNEEVDALAVFDDGSGAGPALYAGGFFTEAGGEVVNHVARWNGQSWSALGSGTNLPVYALAVFDDGSGAGPALYAGGAFTSAGGQAASHVAKWDGQSWSALASGVDDLVRALTVFDDGSGAGPALYAGGLFTSAGGQAASRVARWDGQSWSALGSGVNGAVRCLSTFDDGSGTGPGLYAGGDFTGAGALGASRIARWDGQAWSALGGGTNLSVFALTVFDDGSGAGAELFAAGAFTTAGGASAQSLAKWDGLGWKALGAGIEPSVYALTVFDDGSGAGAVLCAGGSFRIGPGGDSYIAKWGCPAIDTLPGCSGNPALLESLSSAAEIGSPFTMSLSSSQLATGLGLLFLGFDGTDAAGCGLLAPGLGELLLALAPAPRETGSGSLVAGAVEFALPVPSAPALVGVEVAFQGAVVGVFDPGVPIQLSNALSVTFTQ